VLEQWYMARWGRALNGGPPWLAKRASISCGANSGRLVTESVFAWKVIGREVFDLGGGRMRLDLLQWVHTKARRSQRRIAVRWAKGSPPGSQRTPAPSRRTLLTVATAGYAAMLSR